MKIKHLLTKTLLVAVLLCIGANGAWADAVTVYSQNFTTDKSSGTSTDPADYAGIAAGVNDGLQSTTVSGGVFTSSVGASKAEGGGNQNNYNTYVASFTEVTGDYEVTFTCTWSPGGATGTGVSRLTIMDGSDNAVLTLQKGQNNSTNYHFLVNGTDVKTLTSGNNSDTYNVSATINLKSKKITALSVGTMYSITEAIDFHSGSATGVAKLEIYHKNKANWVNTATLDNILFTKDAITASYANVTFKYEDTNGNDLSAYKADQVVNAEVGSTIASLITATYTADFYNGSVKYEYNDEYVVTGDYTEVQAGGNTVTLKFREKTPVTSVTVRYKYNDAVIASEVQSDIAGLYVGETATVPYRMYVKVGDALYQTAARNTNPYYGEPDVALIAETVVEKNVTPVDLGGGSIELFADLDNSDGNNAGIRASYCSGYDNKAYTSAETLPIGVYKFIFKAQNKGRNSSVNVGDIKVCGISDIYSSNGVWTDKEFDDVAITAPGQLTLVKGGGNTIDCYDVIIAIRKGDFTITTSAIPTSTYATISSAYALDFANATDKSANKTLKAYTVSELSATSATLTEVTQAPANTGIILMGTAGETYNIPVLASASAVGTNYLHAAVTATTLADASFYVLKGGKFLLVKGTADEAARTVPAGKAYLLASEMPAPELALDFGDITGIADIRSKMEEVRGDIFDLQGRKVAQPTKGLYIVNGKKVVIK